MTFAFLWRDTAVPRAKYLKKNNASKTLCSERIFWQRGFCACADKICWQSTTGLRNFLFSKQCIPYDAKIFNCLIISAKTVFQATACLVFSSVRTLWSDTQNTFKIIVFFKRLIYMVFVSCNTRKCYNFSVFHICNRRECSWHDCCIYILQFYIVNHMHITMLDTPWAGHFSAPVELLIFTIWNQSHWYTGTFITYWFLE